jgi:hypothetical protein
MWLKLPTGGSGSAVIAYRSHNADEWNPIVKLLINNEKGLPGVRNAVPS